MGESKDTPEATSKWRMREVAHYNGGKEWFGYRHQCIEQPRLSRMDRYLRKDRSVQSTWRVDGCDVASFDEALIELEVPPRLTIAEMRLLAHFKAEVAEKRDFEDFSAIYSDLRGLVDKGLVLANKGMFRLLFPAIDQAIDRAESNASGFSHFEVVAVAVNNARTAIAKARGEA